MSHNVYNIDLSKLDEEVIHFIIEQFASIASSTDGTWNLTDDEFLVRSE